MWPHATLEAGLLPALQCWADSSCVPAGLTDRARKRPPRAAGATVAAAAGRRGCHRHRRHPAACLQQPGTPSTICSHGRPHAAGKGLKLQACVGAPLLLLLGTPVLGALLSSRPSRAPLVCLGRPFTMTSTSSSESSCAGISSSTQAQCIATSQSKSLSCLAGHLFRGAHQGWNVPVSPVCFPSCACLCIAGAAIRMALLAFDD